MFKEYQETDRIAYAFPWAYCLEENIIINKNYSLSSVFKFRGQDLDSCTIPELERNLGIVNNFLKRLGGNWTIHCEARRKKSEDYNRAKSIKEIPTFIVETEREEFFKSGTHYESEYYLTFTYKIPIEKTEKFFKLFLESENKQRLDLYSNSLQIFKDTINAAFSVLGTVCKELKALNTDEIINYFHSCISDTEFKIKLSEEQKYKMLFDGFISDCEFIGGLEPKLGEKYIGTVSIYNFPDVTTSVILDRLNRLPLEYRFVTRYMIYDKLEALKEINSYLRNWDGKVKDLWQVIKEIMTKEETKNININAYNNANELKEVRRKIEAEETALGQYTATIVLSNKNQNQLFKELKDVKNLLNSLGFIAEVETINTEESWQSSIPGNIYSNVRRPPMDTQVLTTLLPISAVWAGDEINKHLKEPSLFYSQTSGNTPFRANIHYNDVGHSLVVGPTGAGKSVLLAFMAVQFKKYKNSQVFSFDKGGSSRVLTKAIGGNFYDLGEDDLRFQPLAKCDDPKEREWCQEWIENILESEGVELNPQKKSYIWTALNSLATTPTNFRTLSSFANFVGGQDLSLKEGLAPYFGKGQYAKYFDGDKETISNSNFQVFEMEKIAQTKKAIAPCLDYLFHKIETERLDGKPTLITLDECWLFFDNPKFEAKIREWLKVLRKKNTSVVFATQSLSDIANSNILSAVLDACYTRFFLPNANAKQDSDIYKLFGLNEREIEIIYSAIIKRQYYFKSPKGSRLFELALSSLELAYVATSGETDQQKCKEYYHLSTEEFNIKWLNYKKLDGETIVKNVNLLMENQNREEDKK